MTQTGIITKAIVVNGKGEVLLLRRSKTAPRRALQWDLPGGLVDDDDTSYAAACVRELQEEAGISVGQDKLTVVYAQSAIATEKAKMPAHWNDVKSLVWFYYLVQLSATPTVGLSYEHDQFQWFSFEEALKVSEYDRLRQALAFVRQNLINGNVPTVLVAKALVLDEAGDALLLTRSSTHPTLPLEPDLPGGEVERGEEPKVALLREIQEETGLRPQPQQLRLLFAEAEVQNGTNFVRMLFVVRATGVKPIVALSWEHGSYDWLPLADVPNLEADKNTFAKHALAYVRAHNLLEQS